MVAIWLLLHRTTAPCPLRRPPHSARGRGRFRNSAFVVERKMQNEATAHLFDWELRSAFGHRVLSRTGVMLPCVVGASAATSCRVQKRFPCAYLRQPPQNGCLETSGFTASSGTVSRVEISVNQRHRARPNSFFFVFDDKGCLGT